MPLHVPPLAPWRAAWQSSPRVRRATWGTLAAAAIVALGVAISTTRDTDTAGPLPDFSAIEDITARKEAFFAYFLPLINDRNTTILAHRERLATLRATLAEKDRLKAADERWLRRLGDTYRLPAPTVLHDAYCARLLGRVDIIPPSLALAQAALESAWGTSRFAREGNNLFGQRDYTGGGLVPRRRPAGATWTVAHYETPRQSIHAYIHNLNTHERYRTLRRSRQALRAAGQPVGGPPLVGGLGAYSSQGSRYLDHVRAVMRTNQLTRFDT